MTNDPTDWRAWYTARRRTGWDQPSGALEWSVDLPEDAQAVVLSFTRLAGFLPVSENVELEWSRCGTGVAVEVRDAKGVTVCSQWQECVYWRALQTPDGTLVAVPAPTQEGVMIEHEGLRLRSDLRGPLRVRGPAFFGEPWSHGPIVFARVLVQSHAGHPGPLLLMPSGNDLERAFPPVLNRERFNLPIWMKGRLVEPGKPGKPDKLPALEPACSTCRGQGHAAEACPNDHGPDSFPGSDL